MKNKVVAGATVVDRKVCLKTKSIFGRDKGPETQKNKAGL